MRGFAVLFLMVAAVAVWVTAVPPGRQIFFLFCMVMSFLIGGRLAALSRLEIRDDGKK